MKFYLVNRNLEIVKELYAKSDTYPVIMVPGDFVELHDGEGWFANYDIVKRGFVHHSESKLAYNVVYYVEKISTNQHVGYGSIPA